ncbi:hypothetical protein [Vulcanococcus sp.]|jgi:hypothetical protein|uniref:hypothetical protein n=1 Tax=Vulcanococcus sp. TaxID=2856995 RepID=UPI0037DA170C
MTQPQTLLQAALNRLSARLGSGLADAAAELAVLAQDAPERLRQEWDLFREEVELEAERLERGDAPADDGLGVDGVLDAQTAPPTATPSTAPQPSSVDSQRQIDPQQQIDDLRAQVVRLTRRLEDQP